ncbi:MAG TPA: nitrous oxide reductase accessory protein NosL [Nitrospirota bacterium]|nr:nitrous oxide reductase accessory protein NosL [Nitrospirota bacterium]
MAVLLRTIALTISLITFSFTIVSAADTIKCTECGMMVDVNSKFASKIVQADGTLYFCDIGDLFSYLKRTKQNSVKAEVKDYKTGEWIDARAAYYVHAEKIFSTPMGWGIASFKDQKDATGFGVAMDFDSMTKAPK